MATVKDWVMLGRPHTASLTTAVMILGWLVGGGALFSLTTLMLFIVALGFHWSGFVHNNTTDYKDDLNDAAKSHFPMNRGVITIEGAKIAFALSFVVIFAIGSLLALNGAYPVVAITILLTAFATGLLYNHLCKKSLTAPLFIGVSFALLPAYGYFLATAEIKPVFWLLVLYCFAQMLFQIAIEGYLKDIESDKVNGLKKLGAMTFILNGERVFSPSKAALAFSAALKVLPIIIGAYIVLLCSAGWQGILGAGMFVLFTGVSIIVTSRLMAWGKFDRRVKLCSLTEITVYFALVWAFAGSIGILASVVLTVYPLVYFVILNRYLWGTIVEPRV